MKQILSASKPWTYRKKTNTDIALHNIDDHDKIMQNAKSLLQTVQNTLTTADVHNKSTQHFLQKISLDVETYMDALKIS